MLWDADNERDERKQAFIARMKDRKSHELLDPLGEKLLAYEQGEIGPEEVFRAAARAGRRGEELIGDFKKRPDVILAGIAMDENRYLTAIGETGVSVRKAEVTEVFSDAVVVPAGPGGSMSSGAALAVRDQGGSGIELELRAKLPGEGSPAVSTGPGDLTAAHVIHVFVPGKGGAGDIETGLLAALRLADELGSETVAIPGFFSSGGEADRASSASAVLEALKGFEGENLSRVVLCDPDEATIAAWIEELEKYDEE